MQELVQILLLVVDQCFVNDIGDKLFLENNQGVQVSHLVKSVKEDGPGRLKHFDQDVVVDVGDKVGHFVMCEVESMELSLQTGTEPPELLLVLHRDAPGEGQGVLDLLKLEHERKYFIVVVHHLFCEDCRQWSQV